MTTTPSPRAFARGFLLSALPMLAALLPACSRFSSTPEPQIVGHLAPRSGPGQAAGVRLGEVVAMVVEETNQDEQGRVDDRPISVIHGDSGPDLDGFSFQATRLISVNRVSALLGGTTAAQAEKMLGPAQTKTTVLVTPSGGLVGTQTKLVWPVGLSAAERGKWLARYAAEQLKLTEVVTVTDQGQPIFPTIRDAFEAEFRHADRRVSAEWTFSEAKALPGLGAKIAAAEPKAILFCGKAADLLPFRSALRAAKFDAKAPIVFGGEEEEPAMHGDPDSAAGVIYASAFTILDGSDRVQKFVTDFRNRVGQAPDADAALSADAARVLFAAGRKARTFKVTQTSLLDELAKLEIDLPTGPFSFAKDGAALRTVYVLQIENSRSKLLKMYAPEKK